MRTLNDLSHVSRLHENVYLMPITGPFSNTIVRLRVSAWWPFERVEVIYPIYIRRSNYTKILRTFIQLMKWYACIQNLERISLCNIWLRSFLHKSNFDRSVQKNICSQNLYIQIVMKESVNIVIYTLYKE